MNKGMHIRVASVAVLILLGLLNEPAAAADPPATVGALRAVGGKLLTKGEILKLFAGATIIGTAMGSTTSTFQLKYAADGSVTGEGKSPGGSTNLSGSWTANERHQYCQALKTAQGTPIQGCFYYFTWNGRLFAAAKDEPSQSVHERRLSR